MTSPAEREVARALRCALEGVAVGASLLGPRPSGAPALEASGAALGRFLEEVLAAHGDGSRAPVLDGVLLAGAHRTGPNEADLLGLGVLLEDQTYQPLRVRLRVHPTEDAIAHVVVDVGGVAWRPRGWGRGRSGPDAADVLLRGLIEDPASVPWETRAERPAPVGGLRPGGPGRDRDVYREVLTASAHGPFFSDAEFSTLFGLERDVVASLARTFSDTTPIDGDVALALANGLGNLLGYPHGRGAEWSQWISIPPVELAAVLERFRVPREGR
ncbi:MAG: hypothetical protein JNM10_20000 [Planctomycetia bacterium]|nr:hypothetical protein [Planctomycetia bacterium]